jgi:hypothetical protein
MLLLNETLPVMGSIPGWLDKTYQKASKVIRHSWKALESAGCYYDGLPGDYEWDPRWWTGLTDKTHDNFYKLNDASKKLAVLVATGSFWSLYKVYL